MSSWARAMLAVAFLLGSFSSALAQDERTSLSVTTASLYNDCQGENRNFCLGFIAGVVNAMKDIRILDINLREDFCPAKSRTAEERSRIFRAWVESHDKRNAPAYDAVYLALWFGEPCAESAP